MDLYPATLDLCHQLGITVPERTSTRLAAATSMIETEKRNS
jgi:hypothetical protein